MRTSVRKARGATRTRTTGAARREGGHAKSARACPAAASAVIMIVNDDDRSMWLSLATWFSRVRTTSTIARRIRNSERTICTTPDPVSEFTDWRRGRYAALRLFRQVSEYDCAGRRTAWTRRRCMSQRPEAVWEISVLDVAATFWKLPPTSFHMLMAASPVVVSFTLYGSAPPIDHPNQSWVSEPPSLPQTTAERLGA